MNYLVMHPEKGLCVTQGLDYYELAAAMEKMPDVVQELLAAGDIKNDVAFVDSKCYVGEPDFQFYVYTPPTYPDKYEQEVVANHAARHHIKIIERVFGTYLMTSYGEVEYEQFVTDMQKWEPEWKFKIYIEPTPENAICNEEEILKSPPITAEEVPTREQLDDITRSNRSAETVEKLRAAFIDAPVEITVAPVKEVIRIDTAAPDLSIFVPAECRGEAWAFTDESVCLSDVTDDGYCIENNWEDRGLYWIVDCVPRGVRLVHSDTLEYNREFKIEQCGE